MLVLLNVFLFSVSISETLKQFLHEIQLSVFHMCVSPTELDRFLNDEFEAFIEDLKLSAVTSDFDDEIEPKGLYYLLICTSITISHPYYK